MSNINPSITTEQSVIADQLPSTIISSETSGLVELGLNAGLATTDSLNSENLSQAFDLFNQLSAQLSDSYQGLENRVSQLSGELVRLHQQREEELQEKQLVSERLESLLDVLPGGVVVLDQYGMITQCNPAAADLLGEPLLGQLWISIIERSFAPRSDDGHEISLKDGRRISIATRSLNGDQPGQLILLTDQTPTRHLQQQLARHERLSAMGQMMSALAHQIRTPLSAALLYAGHLSDRELDTQQTQKFSQKVQSRLMHLEQMIRQMLLFVKGDVNLSDSVSMEQLAERIWQTLDVVETRYAGRILMNSDVKNVSLECNLDTLLSAFCNLVENACQASKDNQDVCVDIRLLPERNAVFISVNDTGIGMDAETLAKTEDAFFTTKSQGTGLGLAVAKIVAQRHGGEFILKSELNYGTSAGFILPVYQLETCQAVDGSGS